jgi:hypothetical protein
MIEIDNEPSAYEIAETARLKLFTLRSQLRWWKLWKCPAYIRILGTAIEQLLGQYHHDNKPRDQD